MPQTAKPGPHGKRKKGWILLLILLLLTALAGLYWKPVTKLAASMLDKAANAAATPPPVNQAAADATSVPPGPSPTAGVKPSPSASVSPAAAATAPAKAKTSTAVSEAVEIAKSYAAMPPAKAAAVLQDQTPEEIVYAMAEMQSIERAHIWSKMDPGTVADVAYRLKRYSEWTEEEIARLKQQVYAIKQQELLKTPSKNLALTYAQMPPAAAAKLIDQMLQTDSSHTLAVIGNIENAARTRILTVMIQDPSLMDSAISITDSLSK